MAIKPVGQSGRISPQEDDPPKEHCLLEIVDVAITSCESKGYNREDTVPYIDGLIDIYSEVGQKDLSLGREALCRLLKIPIEDIQIKTINILLEMLEIRLITFDIQAKQFNALIELEKKVSNFIASWLRSSGSSSQLILCFLDLYQNILEHLWLLPHLCEDREAYAVITEQNGMRIKNEAQNWILLISKDAKEKEIIDLIESIKSMLEKIAVPARNLDSNFASMKHNLPSKFDCFLFVGDIGNLYFEIKNYHRAIFYFLKLLNMIDLTTESIKKAATENPTFAADPKTLDVLRDGKGLKVDCYVKLGLAYHATREADKEMDCLFKALKMAEKYKFEMEGKICLLIGERVSKLPGDYGKAIEYYTRARALALTARDLQLEAEVNVALGDAYRMLGNYTEADRYYKISLDIATRSKVSRKIEITAFSGIGNIYLAVAEYGKALDWFNKALNLAQSPPHDDFYVGAIYISLGDVYHSLHDNQAALESYEKALQISEKIGNRSMEAKACGGMANVHVSLKHSSEAAHFSNKAQRLEQEVGSVSSRSIAAGTMGARFMQLRNYPEAIECFKQALALAKTTKDPEEQGNTYCHLGCAYAALKDFKQAEDHFLQSINVYAEIQKALESNQWKITLFEQQAYVHQILEGILFIQQQFYKALEITDQRRSRAMVSMLSKRLASQNIKVDERPLGYKDMQRLAAKLKTTFIIYALWGDDLVLAWVISPLIDLGPITIGRMAPEILSLNALTEDMRVPSRVQNSYPFRRVKQTPPSETMRFLEETKEFSSTKPEAQILPGTLKRFHNRLTKWYESLIAPLEKYIPKDEGLSLTIIPDGFLSQIPFAAFRDGEKGPYLIEKYPISIAPSIKVLQLLDALPKEAPTSLPCIMGNPDTKVRSDDLPWSTEEINQVGQLFNVPQETILTRERATAKNTLQKMQNARYIHFSCHGEPDEKLEPDSVFEGLLKLAPDELHRKGYLYAQEVASLSLHSELVFLSACFSGTGKIQREGSIGNVWSFLAAGAQSVIAAHWRVPQSDLTREMVVTFYKHLLNKANKAEALRQAMLMAINKERENPHLWGAYFLSGLK
jgi:CHAT domain-containing protein/uncharacterized protein HemY